MIHRIAPLVLAALLAVLLSGCGGDYSYVRFSSGGIPPAGVATSGSTVFVQTSSSGSGFGTLFAALLLATQSYLSDLDYQRLGGNSWSNSYPILGRGDPPLDPTRRVGEHDCTKPIEDWSANLRCR